MNRLLFKFVIPSAMVICAASSPEAIADQAIRQQYCESMLSSFALCQLQYSIADLQQKIVASGGEPEASLETFPTCDEYQSEHLRLSSALADEAGAADAAFLDARASIDRQWTDAINDLPRQEGEADKSLTRRIYLAREKLLGACKQLTDAN